MSIRNSSGLFVICLALAALLFTTDNTAIASHQSISSRENYISIVDELLLPLTRTPTPTPAPADVTIQGHISYRAWNQEDSKWVVNPLARVRIQVWADSADERLRLWGAIRLKGASNNV